MSLITGLQLFRINLEVIKCWTLLSNQFILQHHFKRSEMNSDHSSATLYLLIKHSANFSCARCLDVISSGRVQANDFKGSKCLKNPHETVSSPSLHSHPQSTWGFCPVNKHHRQTQTSQRLPRTSLGLQPLP